MAGGVAGLVSSGQQSGPQEPAGGTDQPGGRPIDQTQVHRPGSDGARRHALLVALATASLVVGCAGLSVPGIGDGAPAAAFSGDPCSLLTSAEIEAVIGNGSTSGSPEPAHESATESNCQWSLQAAGNPVTEIVSLTIKAPGGRADFTSNRQFLSSLEGSPGSPAAATESETASAGLPADIGISLQSLPGVGDDAFIGAAGTIYAIKNDTEVSLQLIVPGDPNAQQETIDLLKKAIKRLT